MFSAHPAKKIPCPPPNIPKKTFILSRSLPHPAFPLFLSSHPLPTRPALWKATPDFPHQNMPRMTKAYLTMTALVLWIFCPRLPSQKIALLILVAKLLPLVSLILLLKTSFVVLVLSGLVTLTLSLVGLGLDLGLSLGLGLGLVTLVVLIALTLISKFRRMNLMRITSNWLDYAQKIPN